MLGTFLTYFGASLKRHGFLHHLPSSLTLEGPGHSTARSSITGLQGAVDGVTDCRLAILVPSFELGQNNSAFAQNEVTWKTVYVKSVMQRPVTVIDLDPVHPVRLDIVLPGCFGVVFVHADDCHFRGIDFRCQVLDMRQRYAAGSTPGTPEVQQDHLALKSIEVHILASARFRGEFRRVILLHQAWVVDKSFDLMLTGSTSKSRSNRL